MFVDTPPPDVGATVAAAPPGPAPAAVALDEATARQLWSEAVESYALVESHLLRLDDRLGQFVAGRGWLAMGYPSADLMVKGEAARMINPTTGQPLSRSSVDRLARWLVLMDRLTLTTGVDASTLDFPARVLRALPKGRGGVNDMRLAEQIAERSSQLADGDPAVTTEHVQEAVDELLADRGVRPKPDRGTHPDGGRAVPAGGEADAAGDGGDAQPHNPPGGGGKVAQPVADGDADEPPGGRHGDTDTAAAKAAADAHTWFTTHIENLDRACRALAAISDLQDQAAAAGYVDSTHSAELDEVRRRFTRIPHDTDLVEQVYLATKQVIDAVDEADDLGF